MEIFSFSRLSKYENCPAGFYRHYCMNVDEPPTLPLVNGKGVHSVIEAAMRLNKKDMLFFKVMSKMVVDNAPLVIDPEEIFQLTYQNMVLAEFHPDNQIEQHLQLPLLPDDPLSPVIQMYIDLNRDEGGHVRLVDWKTNHKSYHPTETKQLGLYSWALYQKYNKPVRSKLVFLRTRETPEHEFTKSEMEEAREWALTLAFEIQDKLYEVQHGADHRELFPTRPGGACRYCGYSHECVNGELPVPGEIKTYEEAQALGGEIIRLESALDNMKRLMKGYVETCGPVAVEGNRQFIMQESSYWKWPPKALKAAFDRITGENKDPFEYFSLTATQAGKLGWNEEVIKKLGAQKKNKSPALKHVQLPEGKAAGLSS